MVKVKQLDLEKAIKLMKYRIAHHEKHGNGALAMHEKAQLLIQQKRLKDRYPK